MWSAISAFRQLARPVAADTCALSAQHHHDVATKGIETVDWDALHAELDTAPSLLTSSVAPGSDKSNVDLLRNCNESIVHSVHTLITETENVTGTSKYHLLLLTFHPLCIKYTLVSPFPFFF